ncbi:chymotrypsin inhibitor-like [Photinus pyralis]|uniref:chymotrypsin inhibitor-like n=1 Tax=Photinus pyralis TaxID=7054 RepID=UPI0012670E1B|nr:chymotrypsin inhibitor-like [Photinus pyralis]
MKAILFLVLVAAVAINSLYVSDDICGENARRVDCASPCGPTCQNPQPHTGPCITSCKLCVCNEGYLEDTVTKKCVEASKCPPSS